jgi:hypothetical protein
MAGNAKIPSSGQAAQKVSEQQDPTGGHVNQALDDTQLDPQPELSPKKQALKDKLGLDGRVCAKFKAEDENVSTF